jgi:hypothetical protein
MTAVTFKCRAQGVWTATVDGSEWMLRQADDALWWEVGKDGRLKASKLHSLSDARAEARRLIAEEKK